MVSILYSIMEGNLRLNTRTKLIFEKMGEY